MIRHILIWKLREDAGDREELLAAATAEFDALTDGMSDWDSYHLIKDGRDLYMAVDDRCGPPYTIVFDHDYEKLCPWADVIQSGKTWPDELTDAAVELFECEKNNREQRRKRRKDQ